MFELINLVIIKQRQQLTSYTHIYYTQTQELRQLTSYTHVYYTHTHILRLLTQHVRACQSIMGNGILKKGFL